jgi:O-antigen ligase
MRFERVRESLVQGMITIILAVELLLAFSRGAWGAFGFAAALVLGYAFFTSRSGLERMRIVVFGAAMGVLLTVLIAAILTVPQVSDLFAERASLIQSYDAGRVGRFGRHILGAQMALENPLGIGPLQFMKFFPEEPHNSFLDAFLAGGWTSGLAYFVLILTTLVVGVRAAFIAAPWREPFAAICASFVALTAESYVIDVLHWRHYFLLIGLIWGLFAATRRGRRSSPSLDPARTAGRTAPLSLPAAERRAGRRRRAAAA